MKKAISVLVGLIFCMTLFSGCVTSSEWNPLKSGGEVKIAVLGSSSVFEERKDFFAGVDLAIEDLAQKNVKVSYKFFDDEGNYDKGVSLAKEVAEDSTYLLAFSLQNFETVDTISSLFEESKKPLVIVDGCYDSTMEKGYNYIFNLTVSAKDAGNALGQYAINHSYKWVSISHSGKYSLDFQEGFRDATENSSTSNIVDLVAGPNKDSEVEATIARWKELGVQAVVLSFDDMDWAVQLVKQIKTLCPEMQIMGDQYFNNLGYMNDYGQYLEGLVMSSSFPVDSNDRLQNFYNNYESRITYLDITSITAQGYDIVNMIVDKLDDVSNVTDFISGLKSTGGYEGITGIKFKLNGCINKTPKYWIVKNGVVYREENLNAAGK
ncbi:MAG: amino acid ABC transporter substrate-binding protein [Eubacteriales bacterium SKADARSKE-1]|nr:amino acid ABC transporter substrate-binding protein [Eubacteriales bacterium SKADARSKE-1]